MPTAKPRITISLNQHTYDVISSLAALQGTSRAGVVGDIIESISGALGRTVALLEAAANAPQEVKSGLVQSIESIHGDLVAACGDSTARLEDVFDGFAGHGQPPHSNTGVRVGEFRGPRVEKR